MSDFVHGFRLLIGPDDGADAAQMCFRALFLFIFGVICIRLAGRRTFAQYTPLDIIVALIVGSNISRLMTGKTSFFPGLAATLTLVLLHRLFAYATLRWGVMSSLLKGKPIIIVKDGRLDEKQLHRAQMSRQDLMEALRMEQVDDVADAKLATVEAGGKVSVVKMEKK